MESLVRNSWICVRNLNGVDKIRNLFYVDDFFILYLYFYVDFVCEIVGLCFILGVMVMEKSIN